MTRSERRLWNLIVAVGAVLVITLVWVWTRNLALAVALVVLCGGVELLIGLFSAPWDKKKGVSRSR